jgi:hypothetical protein
MNLATLLSVRKNQKYKHPKDFLADQYDVATIGQLVEQGSHSQPLGHEKILPKITAQRHDSIVAWLTRLEAALEAFTLIMRFKLLDGATIAKALQPDRTTVWAALQHFVEHMANYTPSAIIRNDQFQRRRCGLTVRVIRFLTVGLETADVPVTSMALSEEMLKFVHQAVFVPSTLGFDVATTEELGQLREITTNLLTVLKKDREAYPRVVAVFGPSCQEFQPNIWAQMLNTDRDDPSILFNVRPLLVGYQQLLATQILPDCVTRSLEDLSRELQGHLFEASVYGTLHPSSLEAAEELLDFSFSLFANPTPVLAALQDVAPCASGLSSFSTFSDDIQGSVAQPCTRAEKFLQVFNKPIGSFIGRQFAHFAPEIMAATDNPVILQCLLSVVGQIESEPELRRYRNQFFEAFMANFQHVHDILMPTKRKALVNLIRRVCSCGVKVDYAHQHLHRKVTAVICEDLSIVEPLTEKGRVAWCWHGS